MTDWKNIGLELLDAMQGKGLSPYVTSYGALTMAYRAGDVETFNDTVSQMRLRFIADYPNDVDRVHYEKLFNDAQLFPLSMQLYVLVFLAVCISWLRWPAELSRAATIVLLLAFLIHTFGLVSRMYIQGRPRLQTFTRRQSSLAGVQFSWAPYSKSSSRTVSAPAWPH